MLVCVFVRACDVSTAVSFVGHRYCPLEVLVIVVVVVEIDVLREVEIADDGDVADRELEIMTFT